MYLAKVGELIELSDNNCQGISLDILASASYVSGKRINNKNRCQNCPHLLLPNITNESGIILSRENMEVGE